jgi:hypothetical protein
MSMKTNVLADVVQVAMHGADEHLAAFSARRRAPVISGWR